MEYVAGKTMAAFVAIELREDTPPLVFIVDERKNIVGFDDAPELL